MRIVATVLAIVIAAGAATVFARTTRWNRSTGERVNQLNASAKVAVDYDERALQQVPPPVARYFRRVLRDGHPLVTSAIATQEAEFFINGAWRRLEATQHFVADPPGFVWDARISMAPLVTAFVRDSYVVGRAGMTASLLGVYTLVDQNGINELNAGALQRLLGEAVWMPTALLPSARVRWTPRDGDSAIATLSDAGLEASLTFEFDEDGRIITIRGDRFKENAGTYSMQPWEIRCDEYRNQDGMLIPMHCQVAWVTGGVRQPYWRGRIASITYRYE